jgi:hypothetical protein
MPFICPRCKKPNDDVVFRGPVLIAEGVISVGDGGIITGISPIRAIQTIVAGKEMDAPNMTYTCGKCKNVAPREEWKVVLACVLSGEPTDNEMRFSFGKLPIAAEFQELAAQVFTAQNMDWSSSVITKDDFNV